MKNSNFKSSFVSTLAVTVVGVLLFGVNAALSETPVASPPGSGTAPTFTGLNLTGSVRNETSGIDYITVDDGLNVAGDALVQGDLMTVANQLDIGTDLHVVGSIKNPSSGSKPVTIDDGLKVTGDLTIDPTGNINAAKITPGKIMDQNGNVVDTGSLHVEGGMEVSQGLKVGGELKANNGISNSSSDSVSINDGLKVTGNLINDGNAEVKGYLTLGSDQFLTADKISSSVPLTKRIRFNSPIGVMSDIVSDSIYLDVLSSIKAKGWLITETSVDVQGSILNTKVIVPDPKYPKTTVDLPVTISDNLDVTGDFSLDGEVTSDLSVTGKLTADGGIGTFTRFISDSDGNAVNGNTPYTVNAGVGAAQTLYCPTENKVISCQVKPVDVTGYDVINFSLSAYMDSALTYCEAKVHNGSTTEKKFLIYQICFDSTQ